MQFLTYLPHGYLIEYNFKPWRSPYRHRFGGQHVITGAVCPNCERPLVLYFTIDTSDPRLRMSHLPVAELPLLYCPHCPIATEKALGYRVLRENQIEIVQYTPITAPAYRRYNPAEPSPYPEFYPERRAHLIPLPSELQVLFKLMNRGLIDDRSIERALPEWATQIYPRHQIGGEPLIVVTLDSWMNGYGENCPLCSRPMPFLACIGNEYTDEFMEGGTRYIEPFGGMMGVWWAEHLFHFCEHCMVVVGFFEGD